MASAQTNPQPFFEDVEIVGDSCCLGATKASKSSQSIRSNTSSRLKYREGGIKLTKKTKSFTKINQVNRLKLNSETAVKVGQPTSRVTINYSDSNHHSLASSRKLCLEKCREYKNQKIRERTTEAPGPVEASQNTIVVNVTNVKTFKDNLMSTLHNTAKTSTRTIKASNLVPNIEKLSFIKGPQVVSIIHQADKTSQASSRVRPPTEQRQREVSRQRRSRKTLQNLYLMHSGKRIVTQQSQLSSVEDDDHVSIAQSFEFPNMHRQN